MPEGIELPEAHHGHEEGLPPPRGAAPSLAKLPVLHTVSR